MSIPAGVSAPAGSPHPPPFDVPAGWYEDPRGGPQVRYWDGEGWTDHVAPAGKGSAQRPPEAPREGRGRGALWILAVTALAAFMVALVLLESPESDLTNPLDSAELAQDIGGTVPGLTITEFEDGFTGHPGGLVVGSDGNFWISEQFDDRIATFDIKTKKATEFDIPAGTAPHNAYSGPDGNIWFTGLNDNIGVFDIKTHQTKLFRKGITKGAEPHVIIADPTNDRFLWFTETNGNRIARFDRQTEKIVEFDLPARTLPHGIVPSPDGKSIWWCEQGPDTLGVLDLSQGPIDSQQDFDDNYRRIDGLPAGSGPHDPLFGPDGNVYLTLQDTNELGRYLVKEDRFETFPVGLAPYPGKEVIEGRGTQSIEDAADPDSLRSFYTLANGADGRTVFFNAAVENAVAMFDLDTEKVFLLKKGISPGGGPLFVVLGPDKNIWFTEVGLITNLPGRIARLEIAAARDTHPFSVTMTPKATVPPSKGAAGANGTFTASYKESAAGAILTWKLSYSGLTGPAIAAHIHKGKPGFAARPPARDILVPLCGPCENGQQGTAKISKGVIATLESGNAYVNVHTAQNDAGEIRGQIKVPGA